MTPPDRIIDFMISKTVRREGGTQTYTNSIKLFLIMRGELPAQLQKAGLDRSRISIFGDFDGSPYNEESFMTVIAD